MTTLSLSDKSESTISKKLFRKPRPDNFVFGKKVGLMTKLFGCWHENISRPFVHNHTAYRSCLHCGARKQFNTETLETYGAFYFPPIVRQERI